MDKKTAQKIVLAVLAVIFVIFLIRFFWGRGKNPAEVKGKQVAAAPQSAPKPKAVISEDANWGRCPFSGRVYVSPKASSKSVDLKLSGILWEENNPSALINNSIFKEGDAIGSFTLLKIKKSGVIVTDGNKEVEIKLGQK